MRMQKQEQRQVQKKRWQISAFQPQSRWQRTGGASGYTGVSASTLAKLRLTGSGPRYSKLGKIVLYDVTDLDEWIASRKRRSTSEPPSPMSANAACARGRGRSPAWNDQ